MSNLYKRVLVGCKFSLSLFQSPRFASLGRGELYWVSPALNAVLQCSSAAVVFLDFELVCFLGINIFIKPLSALLKRSKSLQKIIYSTLHTHSPLITRIIWGIFEEEMKYTYIIIRKSSHIHFIWCIHTERHL